jgi:4-hydroxybenzoyl-CoA reductase subunit beta
MVRLVDIENNKLLRERLPVLPAAAAAIATPLIRESGTVGGNLMLDTRCFISIKPGSGGIQGLLPKADGDKCLVVPRKVCYATYSGDLAPVFMTRSARRSCWKGRTASASAFIKIFRTTASPQRQAAEEILTHVLIQQSANPARQLYEIARARLDGFSGDGRGGSH